jgi:hypothetical protein
MVNVLSVSIKLYTKASIVGLRKILNPLAGITAVCAGTTFVGVANAGAINDTTGHPYAHAPATPANFQALCATRPVASAFYNEALIKTAISIAETQIHKPIQFARTHIVPLPKSGKKVNCSSGLLMGFCHAAEIVLLPSTMRGFVAQTLTIKAGDCTNAMANGNRKRVFVPPAVTRGSKPSPRWMEPMIVPPAVLPGTRLMPNGIRPYVKPNFAPIPAPPVIPTVPFFYMPREFECAILGQKCGPESITQLQQPQQLQPPVMRGLRHG